MEFIGKITKVVERKGTSERTGNEWKTVCFVFEYKENPTDPWNDRVYLETRDEKIIEHIREGALAKVGFRHNTRNWNGRTYTDIKMNSFEPLRAKEPTTQQQITFTTETKPQQPTEEQSDDLPF